MRGDHDSICARTQCGEIPESPNVIGSGGEIEQQHMPTFDSALDAGNEDEATLVSVAGQSRIAEDAIVKGDGEHVETKLSRSVD